jgi:hypothetical protein
MKAAVDCWSLQYRPVASHLRPTLKPEKLPRLKRSFAHRPIISIAESMGLRALLCGIVWIVTDDPCHITASRLLSMPEK